MDIIDVDRSSGLRLSLWRADDPTRRAFLDFDCLVRRAERCGDLGIPLMHEERSIMNMVVSAGIIAFGVGVVVGTIIAGRPLAWTIMGLFPILVGVLSLVGSVRAGHGRKPVRSDLQSARLVELGLKAKK